MKKKNNSNTEFLTITEYLFLHKAFKRFCGVTDACISGDKCANGFTSIKVHRTLSKDEIYAVKEAYRIRFNKRLHFDFINGIYLFANVKNTVNEF